MEENGLEIIRLEMRTDNELAYELCQTENKGSGWE